MKIAIDARFIGPEGTGLGKYTEKLIKNLQVIDPKNSYFILLRKDNWQHLKISARNFQKVLADTKWYSLAEQIHVPKIVSRLNPDLVHIPHFNVPINIDRPFVVTIHDLIHHHFSQESVTTKNPIVYRIKRSAYKFAIGRAINKSKKIIVPSNFVKSEVSDTFKISESKIAVTYEAAEEEYFETSQVERLKSKEKYILYVGNAYPHKNINNLIDALHFLKGIKLVLVCPRDIFWERLQNYIWEQKLGNSVTVKGYLPTKDLLELYKNADAYVFPSLAEGFGIPGLNAMAAGVPLITSDIPVFREIYQDAACYFNPQDSKDIAAKIKKVIENKNLQTELINKEKNQVTKYSWKKMAKQTLSIYESSLSKKV